MAIRGKFDTDLQDLQNKLTELGHFSVNALEKAIIALETQNLDLALEVIEEDVKANILEEEINDAAILLIAKQQPVAIDLRRVIVAIKIATDIERIADFAVNIAKSAIRIGNEPLIKPIVHIKRMYELNRDMLRLSIEAYNEEDLGKAKKVSEMDDEVDSLYGETIKDLLKINQEKPECISQITQLSFISRYLERSADHTTNIVEHVFYMVKGKRYDLNS
jgi:phosphate transport system protein